MKSTSLIVLHGANVSSPQAFRFIPIVNKHCWRTSAFAIVSCPSILVRDQKSMHQQVR